MEATGPPEQPPAARAAPGIEPRDRSIVLVCGLLLLVGMPIGWLAGGDNSAGDVIGLIVAVAISLSLMVWLVTRLVPRLRVDAPSRATRNALILGILAVIVGLLFWTGLPFAFGAAAVALGLSLQRSVPPSAGRGRATAAVVLGAIAVVAAFVLLLIG
jgi:hypothetical protein